MEQITELTKEKLDSIYNHLLQCIDKDRMVSFINTTEHESVDISSKEIDQSIGEYYEKIEISIRLKPEDILRMIEQNQDDNKRIGDRPRTIVDTNKPERGI